jgi:hypothetical protein
MESFKLNRINTGCTGENNLLLDKENGPRLPSQTTTMRPFLSFILLPLLSLLLCAHAGPTEGVEKFLSRSGHTNNWAVLVSTSRFWFNYRVSFNSIAPEKHKS